MPVTAAHITQQTLVNRSKNTEHSYPNIANQPKIGSMTVAAKTLWWYLAHAHFEIMSCVIISVRFLALFSSLNINKQYFWQLMFILSETGQLFN